MCGITGFTGRIDKELLISMTKKIYHRGPDDDGFYFADGINLGMRRLSVLDIQTGKQPIHNEHNNLWVVFNGEIYNHVELRKKLINSGHKFYTNHSDTELIVHLFEQYGELFVNKINGMFAIALWNTEDKSLRLYRDRIGVKPLFYTHLNENIIFGSEIKTILTHYSVRKEPNYEALYHYFSLRNIPAPFTSYKNIFSLLPGEMLLFSNGKLIKNKWWSPDFSLKFNFVEEIAQNHILELLQDSVKIRMQSDVTYGAYLSGGLDSSAVVALMARFSNMPINTFSLGYEDDFKNKEADIFYARKISQLFNTNHQEYIMTSNELMNDLPSILQSFDQPFSGTISTFFLSKLIKQHVVVALSGDGADELFGSYFSHRTAIALSHLDNIINKTSFEEIKNDPVLFLLGSPEYFYNLHKSSKNYEPSWRYSQYIFPDEEKQKLLSNVFSNNFSTSQLINKYFNDIKASESLNKILEMEWKTQLPDQVLAFVDFLSMAHSVEVRSPFLDYRLVEYCAGIPSNLKIENGRVKSILKNTLEGILPESLINRKKEGFVLPVYDWMMTKMKPFCYDILSENRLKKHGLFNQIYVDNLLKENYIHGNKKPAQLWTLINFQIWWELNFK